MIEQWDDEIAHDSKRFCTRCGAELPAGALFCARCGQAVTETATVAATPPPAPVPQAAPMPPSAAVERAPANSRRVLAILVGILVVALALFGGLRALDNLDTGLAPGGVPAANLPPLGTIWFGSSFDPGTFSINGQNSSFAQGSSLAFVAHLPRSISSGDANMRVSYNGQTLANSALNIQGSGDVFGSTYSALYPGSWTITITDLGGNTLATGSYSVH